MITRLVGTAVLFGLAAVVFTQADAVWLFLITQTLVLSVVFLSIPVVTGLGGYIPLCQGAFAAIGGFAVFPLSELRGWPSLPAAVAGRVQIGRASCRERM